MQVLRRALNVALNIHTDLTVAVHILPSPLLVWPPSLVPSVVPPVPQTNANKRARDEGRSAPEPHGRGRVHSSRSNEPPKSTNEWKELFRNLSIAGPDGQDIRPYSYIQRSRERRGPWTTRAQGRWGATAKSMSATTLRVIGEIFGQCGSNLKVAAKRTNPKGEKVRSISLCDFGRRSARKFMTLNPLQHLVSELRIWVVPWLGPSEYSAPSWMRLPRGF